MTAVIQTLVFDQKSFPMSPYAQFEMQAVENDVIFYVTGLSSTFNKYSQILSADESPGLKNAPEECCLMLISAVGTKRDPSLLFEVINRNGTLLYSTSMSLMDAYIDAIATLADMRDCHIIPKDRLEFARFWGATYLKDVVFKENLIATDEFWEALNERLRTATAPLYVEMEARRANSDRKVMIMNATTRDI